MYKCNSFNDSHLHFLGIGLNLIKYIDLSQVKSIDEMIDLLSNVEARDYIIARGWNQNQLVEKRFPTKKDLARVNNNVPIVLIRTCGHVLVCNDEMIEAANVNSATSQIEGGSFNLDSGLFTENALELIYSKLPKPSKEEIKKYFIASNSYLLSQGITSIGSDDFSTLNVNYELIIECLEELYLEEKIQVRLLEQVNLPSIDLLNDYIKKGYHKRKYKGFKLGPLKILADGSLGARTAYLNDVYTDDLSTRGIAAFSQEELNELVYLADSNGMDVAIHAIGDGMIENVINAIWNSISKTNRTHHRHSIIHAQLANRGQIKRMRDLSISTQVQPIFLNSDISIIENRLGERSEESYLFNTMYKEGLKVAFGTDSPVESSNPFHNLYCAITRKSIKNPELDAFLVEEGFTLSDALTCYTNNSYYLSYDEHNYKNFNDYIIVDKNINECSVEELKDVKVLETYIDGKLVFKSTL